MTGKLTQGGKDPIRSLRCGEQAPTGCKIAKVKYNPTAGTPCTLKPIIFNTVYGSRFLYYYILFKHYDFLLLCLQRPPILANPHKSGTTTVAPPQRIKTGMRHKAGMGMRKPEYAVKTT
ncbi:hypothetical protein DY000_02059760 [Brassica cretica]|uniref:Ribosomal protein L2 C-terminal domain-containing protein n=1 Tax=Brassica cretica TaxID=69181 RepID=A0ABQ7AQY0_BRACR|nr:hypothetical protein DY000_02059760 [Brassica cretica]